MFYLYILHWIILAHSMSYLILYYIQTFYIILCQLTFHRIVLSDIHLSFFLSRGNSCLNDSATAPN